jgi:ABC-2 type transport system permease protein
VTLAGVAVLIAVAVGMFFTHQKSTPATLAKAERQAEQDFQQQQVFAAEVRARCESAKGTPEAGDYPPDCAQMTPPTRDNFQAEWFMPPSYNFREAFGIMLTTLAAILALVAFVAGASYVGAEWSSGGMMNLLLWRTQRLRVIGTKLAVLLVGLTTLTVALTALWTATFWMIGTRRGTTAGMTSGAWQSFALTGLRGLALVLVAGVIGFALASLGRHTAMAFGVAIGVVVVLQFGLASVLSMAKVPFFEAFLIPVWGVAWMDKSITLSDNNSCNFTAFGGGSCEPNTLDLTWQMSGGVMATAVVLIVGAAIWTMRSRDVT